MVYYCDSTVYFILMEVPVFSNDAIGMRTLTQDLFESESEEALNAGFTVVASVSES